MSDRQNELGAAPIDRTYPLFVFGRRCDIELETGLILAGMLVVDIPKGTKLKRRHQRLVARIIQELLQHAQSGQMPHDALIHGWQDARPSNAADDSQIDSWAETRLHIAVRIDPRHDGLMRLDSDIRRQMGMLKEH